MIFHCLRVNLLRSSVLQIFFFLIFEDQLLFSIQKIKTRRYPCHKQELIHSLYSLFQNLLFAPYFLSADGGLIEWHSGRPLDFNPIP